MLEDINKELIHLKQNAQKYGRGQLFTDTMDSKMLNSCYVQFFLTYQG